jgi:hypothetical protein
VGLETSQTTNIQIWSYLQTFCRVLRSDIYRAFSIPGVREVTHMPGLFQPGNVGLRDAFQPDLTPVLQYRVEEPALVNVSVFTQEAHLVKSVSQGFQSPGAYSYVWDFRNDDGDKVRRGYYVGVVTMGVSSTVRKAMQAP